MVEIKGSPNLLLHIFFKNDVEKIKECNDHFYFIKTVVYICLSFL